MSDVRGRKKRMGPGRGKIVHGNLLGEQGKERNLSSFNSREAKRRKRERVLIDLGARDQDFLLV